ncbi:class I SAM-dependent methyltransferase [Georgenia subflava]|uniref:Methyltransferase domain-containing protein n=1 Tax=Georgenia subflava TaxID=1622177 RepID=A0A6N7EEZ3_9MICO|nr:class I SAM-dependent methyltransferase [Georgenia subflava]MPV36590.1 methyltransferase domain-containing protein [Georgenia subflava]
MTGPSTSCPACATPAVEPFYRRSGIPVNSCLLVTDRDSALGFPTGDLALVLCPGCGFVWNQLFDPALTSYSPDYEETQGFSARFQQFITELATDWLQRYDLVGRRVAEIGCGKGEFLVEMVRAGAASGVGIDPGVHPERVPEDVRDRTEWIAGFFPEDLPDLDADAVVCRHTLEHIAPVGEWMRQVRAAIGERTDTIVLFELPDTRRVLDEGAFWDVYYEHCSYFTAGSLARLFRATGFEVVGLSRAYDDQYLLIEARPATVPVPGEPFDIEDDQAELAASTARFAAAHAEMLDHWRSRSREVAAAGGRSVIWGSGSKGVAFLSALGADGALVDAAVDINPYKHDRYMAGTGHLIVPPATLKEIRPELVVAMNETYLGEIGRDLSALGVDAQLEAL